MEQLRSAGSARDAVIVVRLPQELRDGLREQADREDRTLTSPRKHLGNGLLNLRSPLGMVVSRAPGCI